ncbi:MAG TPA: 50S ribosomal protein L6 [Patescibacteria group bacterium]
MSKIGKLPIIIKEGVSVAIANGVVTITGPKATESYTLPGGINAEVVEGKIVITQDAKTKNLTKNLFGLTRALLANIVTGVSVGVEKKLELTGVGYRAQASGQDLTLSVGYSHPVKIKAPVGVTFSVADNVITVSGYNKSNVGLVASWVRAVRPPEPYKGKGIKYAGEYIRKKAGKAAKAVGGK